MSAAHGQFFYHGLCHYCKNAPSELQRCSSCKAIWYCSKDHQELDWKNHKQLCKAISLTSKIIKPISANCTFVERRNRGVSLHTSWMNILKRQLKPFECQMWMFPKICALCYVQVNDCTYDCTNCRNVSYCCLEHKIQNENDHKHLCENLKLCMNIDRYLAAGKDYPQPKSCTATIVTAKTTEDLMNRIEGNDEIERILKVDCLIPGAIVSLCIEKISSTASCSDKRDLVIHVVGAAAAEGTADWSLITEFIYHRIKTLQTILYIFIGPEAWMETTAIVENVSNFCSSCKETGKSFAVKVFRQFYHEIADTIEKPDLIISFNCGLHEFRDGDCDTWKESLPFLARNYDVPFAFTSYTKEELLDDTKLVLESIPNGELTILFRDKNPFASPRPIRDWSTANTSVFYSNGYLGMIVRRNRVPGDVGNF